MSMVEKDELDLDFDIFEPTMSAFAELFTEREKMKVYYKMPDLRFLDKSVKWEIIFLISQRKHMLWYSKDPLRWFF